jgi:hypothetical protein
MILFLLPTKVDEKKKGKAQKQNEVFFFWKLL